MTTFAIGSTSTTALSINTDTTGNVVITATGGVVNAGSLTGAIVVPAGTDAQRPSSPANGTFRYNSESSAFEGYAAGAWGAIGGGGGATNGIFYANSNTIASAFTSTAGYNYSSSGPLLLSANVTVTIGSGSVWQVF
jgi:hypothetical protein